MITVTVTAYKARSGIGKTGKPYFQQILEVSQEGRPSLQFVKFSTDETHVLNPGQYLAKVAFYNKIFELKDGKKIYENVASFYGFELKA